MSVQVRYRRDTAANLALFKGAQGEIVVNTDSYELHVCDGATYGGYKANGVNTLHGSSMQPAIAESSGTDGETLGTGVTTYTSSLQLPAGYKWIFGAGWLVKTTITGITTIDFGLTGSPTLFASNQSPSLTTGSSVIYGQNQLRWDDAPVSLLLTSHTGTNFTAGAVRFVLHYMILNPPTA